MRFATNCADAYKAADDASRRRFNTAVFERIDVRDGRITEVFFFSYRLCFWP